MDYTISYPMPLAEMDSKDDIMDVCVRFSDGRNYTFVFATPQNLYRLMRGEGKGYLTPGLPFLFVEELTEENIEACIAAIAEDRAMLNLHGGDILGLLED